VVCEREKGRGKLARRKRQVEREGKRACPKMRGAGANFQNEPLFSQLLRYVRKNALSLWAMVLFGREMAQKFYICLFLPLLFATKNRVQRRAENPRIYCQRRQFSFHPDRSLSEEFLIKNELKRHKINTEQNIF
jgi:hypothetical protein